MIIAIFRPLKETFPITLNCKMFPEDSVIKEAGIIVDPVSVIRDG